MGYVSVFFMVVVCLVSVYIHTQLYMCVYYVVCLVFFFFMIVVCLVSVYIHRQLYMCA